MQYNGGYVDIYALQRALEEWKHSPDLYRQEQAMRQVLQTFGEVRYLTGPELQNRILCLLATMVLKP